MADVTLTVDGKQVRAPAGTLLIEACKSAGIEVPSRDLARAALRGTTLLPRVPSGKPGMTIQSVGRYTASRKSAWVARHRSNRDHIVLAHLGLLCRHASDYAE